MPGTPGTRPDAIPGRKAVDPPPQALPPARVAGVNELLEIADAGLELGVVELEGGELGFDAPGIHGVPIGTEGYRRLVTRSR